MAQRISSTAKNSVDSLTINQYILLSAVGELSLGNVRMAYDALSSQVQNNPTDPTLRYYLSKTLLGMGKRDEALDQVQMAIKSDPKNKDFLSLAGQLLIETKQYSSAQQIFEQLIAENPSDGHNYVMASALAIEQNKPKEAELIASQYEKLFGFDERTTEIKRTALVAQQRYYDALEYMQQIVNESPASIEYIVSLGDMNAGLGLDKTAIELYERAITIDSARADGYMALARFYDKKGLTAPFIKTLERIFALSDVDVKTKIKLFEGSFFVSAPYRDNMVAIRLAAQSLLLAESHNIEVRLLYGRFLTYIGKIDEAKDHYTNMLEAGADTMETYIRLLEINFYQKDYKDALANTTRALALWPNDMEMNYRYISALWLDGKPLEAIKTLNQQIKRSDVDSSKATLYALRGDIWHEVGKDRKAYADYDRSLQLKPDNALVLNNYAYFLSLEKRDLEKALLMINRACELEKNFSTYLDTQAWVLFTMGRTEAAAEIQQRAIAADRSGSSELLLHYGDILYALGDDFMARTYWKRALEAGSSAPEIEERMARPKAQKRTL